MAAYDQAAGEYDGWFHRPVDHWEDEYLTELLAPLVNGKVVLDLGCGTGWLPDHLSPAAYTGVDCSGPMLAELGRKHPSAETIKAEVGERGWVSPLWLHLRWFDVITATWSLEYLADDLPMLLTEVSALVQPGGVLALHGSLPRGHRRRHFSVKEAPWTPISPASVRAASRALGMPRPRCKGTSALPDGLQGAGRDVWRAALAAPAGSHYSALWTWQL